MTTNAIRAAASRRMQARDCKRSEFQLLWRSCKVRDAMFRIWFFMVIELGFYWNSDCCQLYVHIVS
jgi:hypothetical protein